MRWVESNISCAVNEIISPSKRWHYRKKALLHARWQGKWEFGFLKKKGREEFFIPIPNCPIHEPYIPKILDFLSENLPENIPLKFILIQGGALTFVLKTSERGFEKELPHQIPGIESIWINWNPSAGRRVLNSKTWSHLSGAKWLGVPFQHGPSGFQQVSELSLHALDRAEKFLSEPNIETIFDLYSGIGISLSRWQKRGWKAVGVELNGECCEAARLNSNAEVLIGRVEERLPQLQKMICGDFLVYTNPPRGGHHENVIEFFRKHRPKRIAYLSCNVKSLAADIRLLDYKICSIQPYDFFPQTDHVEVLALLERL